MWVNPEHIFHALASIPSPIFDAAIVLTSNLSASTANMPPSVARRSQWHAGETAVHKLLNVRPSNPTAAGLPMQYGYRVAMCRVIAVGTLDDQGRPWTTVWGGETQGAVPIAQDVVGVRSLVDRRFDPVLQALMGGQTSGETVQPNAEGEEEQQGKMFSGLSIDFESRDRVKLAGRMIVGAVKRMGSPSDEETPGTDSDLPLGELQAGFFIEESEGNCPKYINGKAIRPHAGHPELVSEALPLPQKAVDLIARADLFFLSSTSGEVMDTNHRGGPAGFVRVASNDEGSVSLIYPEYSGNRLYQSLGNLHIHPEIGLCIPDFVSGDVVYLTGRATILVGEKAASYIPHTKLAVRIHVDAVRYVADGLPLRGSVVDYSPYNPPVRPLAAEGVVGALGDASGPLTTATLINREILSPTIARFTFRLSPPRSNSATSPAPRAWRPGQHVTLDFSHELDMGYSHMRDEDPQSLNDDFVRTFTISAPAATADSFPTELEITARRHGPATGLLWRQQLRVPLEILVLGFAGEERFHIPPAPGDGRGHVFVAGGVGITPLLAQAAGVLAEGSGEGLTLYWSIRADDHGLIRDTFQRIPGLAPRTKLFLTAGVAAPGAAVSGDVNALAEELRGLGAEVRLGRLTEADLRGEMGKGSKFYLCMAAGMTKVVTGWLGSEESVFENFEY